MLQTYTPGDVSRAVHEKQAPVYDQLEQRRKYALTAEERNSIDKIYDDLGRSASYVVPTPGMNTEAFAPRNSMQSWVETLYVTIADGTAVTAASKTILVPDYTIPATYMYPGRLLKYMLWGRMSTVITTPGTWTHTLNWGGSGGVVMTTTTALAPDPTAASTNIAWYVEYWSVCRAIGVSGTAFTMGRQWHNDIDDGAAAIANLTAALNTHVFADAAAVATIDTSVAKAISPCITPNVATGSMTCHLAVLQAHS